MADVRERFALHTPQSIVANKSIYMLGVGAVGGWATLLFKKLGFSSFILQDHDVVKDENLGVQCYGPLDVGSPKVEALNDLLLLDSKPNSIPATTLIRQRLAEGKRRYWFPAVDVYVASVDNIEARAIFWNRASRVTTARRRFAIFIDPRMGVDSYEIYAQFIGRHALRLTTPWRKEYAQSFHKNVPPAPCGMAASPMAAFACASAVVNMTRSMLMKEDFPLYMRHNLSTNTVYRGTLINQVEGRLPRKTSLIARRMQKEA